MEAPAFWREAQPSSATRKLEIILVPDCKTDSYKQQLEDNYANMETESKILQHEDNVGRLKLNTKTVDIQALQLHITVVRSINTLTLSYRENNQNTRTGILQARIQHSRSPKHFHHSRTPMEKMKNWKYGEIFFGKNWKNWKYLCDLYNFCSKILLMCVNVVLLMFM